MQVPYFRSDIDEQEIEAVTSVLRSGWLTTGPVARHFEQQFCNHIGAHHAIAVNSCSSGLQAALVAADVGPGDEVITTPLTFCSTIRAIEETGARPFLVDIGSDLNIDCRLIEDAMSDHVRALLPVHIAGLPCDLDALRQLAGKYRLAVVEDAAHAFGSAWRDQPVGSSDFSTAVFSFYANKNLTSGEGGMITTSNEEHAAKLRRITSLGIERGGPNGDSRWQYEVVDRGFKHNMSDVLAAIGSSQLRRAHENARRRSEIADYYQSAFSDLEEIELPPVAVDCTHAWHLFILRLHLGQLTINRDEFIHALGKRGVGCSVHFKPAPLHRWFAHYGPMNLWPRTQAEYPRLVSLPIYPGLTEREQEYVISEVRAVVASCRKLALAMS